MPKLIPELRKQFLEAARNQVLVQDRDFTVRQIASDCGVSAGTLYNYFPSKEALIGAVMMEDWMLCRKRMAQDSEGKEDILEALRAVEAALRSFTDRYRSVFSRYGTSIGTTVSSVFERYEMLIGEIGRAVTPILERFGKTEDPFLPELISEMTVTASRKPDGFERITPSLRRLLS